MEGRNLASALVYGVTYNNKNKQAIGEMGVLINAYNALFLQRNPANENL